MLKANQTYYTIYKTPTQQIYIPQSDQVKEAEQLETNNKTNVAIQNTSFMLLGLVGLKRLVGV